MESGIQEAKVEIYVNKEICEDVVDLYDEENNKNAFYIQSFECSAQKDNFKETGHFKQITEGDSLHRLSHAKSGSRLNPNLRYDNDLSTKEEPIVSIPTISSQASNHPEKQITFETVENVHEGERKTQSSRRPQIPKDPKKDQKGDGHWIKKSQLQKKQKAHQLSINLRKGSPIKTQVNLFTSESSKDSIYESINIADVSKKIKIRKWAVWLYLANSTNQIDDNIHPSELEFASTNQQNYQSKSNTASSWLTTNKKWDISRQNNENNWHSNYISFSSKQESETNKSHWKASYSDDRVPASGVGRQKSDTKENIINDDTEIEWDFTDTKLLEGITPIKNNYFNSNKVRWSPNWVDKSKETDEMSFSKNKHRMIDYQTKAFEEWDNLQTSSMNTNKSDREILKENNNNSNKWRLNEFTNSDKKTPIDEEIIEKYWNILSQKTYTSKDLKERNSLLKAANWDFPKEANKTMLSLNKSEWNLASRRISQERTKKSQQRTNDWKSLRRDSSKSSFIKQKQPSISVTRNRNQISSANTDNQEIVTRRVGGGYTSFVSASSQRAAQKDEAKMLESKSQITSSNEKPSIRGLPGSKRKSCEDLTKSEMNSNTKYKMVSPNRNKSNKLLRKKSDHECFKGEGASSFMLIKKTRSPTFKYFQEIKKNVNHKSSWVPCKYWNGWDWAQPITKSDSISYNHHIQTFEKWEFWGRLFEVNNKINNQKLNYEVSLSGIENWKDRGPLKLEDLSSTGGNNEKSERGFKLKSNRSHHNSIGHEKASIPTSSSNNNLKSKPLSKLQLNLDKAMNQIEELKKQNNKLETINKSNFEQLDRYAWLIEELLLTNAGLASRLQRANTFWELSVKNYFEFIDIYKDVQNAIINEKDVVDIKLKVDNIMQSHVKVIHNFNLDEVQFCIDQNKSILSSLKSCSKETELKLKTIKLNKEVVKNFINSWNGIEIQNDESNESFSRWNELDDLLFSTQRQTLKQSTAQAPMDQSTQNFDSIGEKLEGEENNYFKMTITRLSQELQILKEESEFNSQESSHQKIKIQTLQKELSAALFQHTKTEKDIQTLISELSSYKQKCKKLNEKLQQAKSALDQNRAKWDKRIVEITEKHTNDMLGLKEEIDSISKKLEISNRADEITEIVENLSVMLLWRSGEDSSLTDKQKYLFKSLFGDTATEMYKSKIIKLQNEIDSLRQSQSSMDYGIS